MYKLWLLIPALALLGCSTGTDNTDNTVQLNGLYEGIATYTGTGYLPGDRVEYLRIQPNNQMSWVGLQLIEPFRAGLKINIDTSIKYFQFYQTTGNVVVSDTAVCFRGQLTKESHLYGEYTTDTEIQNRDRCMHVTFDSQDKFHTQTIGGGSGTEGSHTYFMTYTKIGSVSDSIPKVYYGPKNQ